MNERHVLDARTFVEIVVWRLDRLVRGSITGSSTGWRSSQTQFCVLRYDNEAGKGDHRHIGRVEKLYKFVDPAKLLVTATATKPGLMTP